MKPLDLTDLATRLRDEGRRLALHSPERIDIADVMPFLLEAQATGNARIAELAGALRSMRKLARNAVAEQALFLADGLVHGVDRIFSSAHVGEEREPCRGHPCRMVTNRVNESMCPPCAREFARREAVDAPPNIDRRPDVADFPIVLDDEAIATLHANGKCPPSCTIGGRHRCGTLCDGMLGAPGWPCMETRGHDGDCNSVPF